MVLRVRSCCVALVLVWGMCSTAAAHSFWLNLTRYAVEANGNDTINSRAYIGWGHYFPLDGTLEADQLTSYELLAPDGAVMPLKPNPGGFLVADIAGLPEGAYRVRAAYQDQFYTIWNENGEEKHGSVPKTGLTGVKSSGHYQMSAAALLNVGETRYLDFTEPAGTGFEIVPRINPYTLTVEPGKRLPRLTFVVYFQGEPVANAEVSATYAGFSNTGEYAQTATTGPDGRAEILLTAPGVWIVRANHTQPIRAKWKDKADFEVLDTSITFLVK